MLVRRRQIAGGGVDLIGMFSILFFTAVIKPGFVFLIQLFLFVQITLPAKGFEFSDSDRTDTGFTGSLASHLSGVVLKYEPSASGSDGPDSSVIRIPTYFGYHSFMGVLDNYILNHTTITVLKTRRMNDRNFYMISLLDKSRSIEIIYDSVNSLLMLTLPHGY